jgi:hypothetical protein
MPKVAILMMSDIGFASVYLGSVTTAPRSNNQVVVLVKTIDTHRLWFLVGVFLTCMCGLMLQIIETRVLSVLASYTLAFVAISVAILGMTAGALLVFYRFETTYSPARLSGAMARDVLLRLVCAR